ncbi:unnamed protein product [Cladocopium goreaui]|uniref:1,3-beta-glucan synthase n=1 Tax=Cladocopium goreaui TaxID=2562237 RepID=A0A9P1DLG0_9DINO|nr:unnamed protein product [Cladocopium goreaui]
MGCGSSSAKYQEGQNGQSQKKTNYRGEENHQKPRRQYSQGLEDGWVQAQAAAKGVDDWAKNPIIQPPSILNWIVGDPTVQRIGDEIHMWTNGALANIQHYVADAKDPTNFKQLNDSIQGFGTVRPYAYLDEANNKVILFYEKYEFPYIFASKMMAAEAEIGKWEFTNYTKILESELTWEKFGEKRVGNPFVFYNKVKGKYWLYYSASMIKLTDADVDEPMNLGLAEADNVMGPYTRVVTEPLEIPSGFPGLFIKGHGSLKMVKSPEADLTCDGVGVAVCNRLTFNPATNQTGSTLSMLRTTDGGLSWQPVVTEFIGPTLQEGSWKEAFVYGFDTLMDPNDASSMLIYYNARNGWKDATEQVGVSRFPLDMVLKAREAC